MKMIKASCGLMTPLEAKMIGDIDREEKRKEQKNGSKKRRNQFN